MEELDWRGRMAELGSVVRQLREARGWDQEELARRAGLPRSHIGHVEDGDRVDIAVGAVRRIADAFEVTVDDLLVPAGVHELPEGRALFDDLIGVLEEIEALDQPAQAQAREELNRLEINSREQVADLAYRVREYYAFLPPQEYYDPSAFTQDELVQMLKQIRTAVANAIRRLLGSAG